LTEEENANAESVFVDASAEKSVANVFVTVLVNVAAKKKSFQKLEFAAARVHAEDLNLKEIFAIAAASKR